MTTEPPTVTCPGCKAEVRKSSLRRHQTSDACQAATLAAFAEACGYVQYWGHLHYGIPNVLQIRLRTGYRRMTWGRGGVRTEPWIPQWAVRMNDSLAALANEPEDYDWRQWEARQKRAAERGELILAIARKEGLTF